MWTLPRAKFAPELFYTDKGGVFYQGHFLTDAKLTARPVNLNEKTPGKKAYNNVINALDYL